MTSSSLFDAYSPRIPPRPLAACDDLQTDDETSSPSSSSRSLCKRIRKYVVDPRRTFHRYSLLILICMFIPGPYFADQTFANLKSNTIEEMGISNTQFGLLFAVSSLTGVLCPLANPLLARMGRTRMALASGFACSLASLGAVMGYHYNIYILLLASRFFFWLALYGLLMVQTVLVYSVYSGELLAIAYSLTVTAMRFGSLGADLAIGTLHSTYGTEGALWFSTITVVVAFVATILFAYLFRGTTTAQAVRPLLDEQRGNQTFSIELVSEIPRCVFAVLGAIGCLYVAVFSFETTGVDMLHVRYGYNAEDAGNLISIIPAMSLFAPVVTPFLGKSIKGKLYSCVLGFTAIVFGHTWMSLPINLPPFPAFLALGFGFVVTVCAIFTVLPGLVESTVPHEISAPMEQLAVGLTYLVLSVTQFFSNLIVGVLKDSLGSYCYVSTWFACCSFVGLVFTVASLATLKPYVHAECRQPTNLPPEGGEGHVVVFRGQGPDLVLAAAPLEQEQRSPPQSLDLAVHEDHC